LNGWITGGTGVSILHTADGGNTWDIQYAGTGWNMNGVAFKDPLNGFAVGDLGAGIYFLRTSDGGEVCLAGNSISTDLLIIGYRNCFLRSLTGSRAMLAENNAHNCRNNCGEYLQLRRIIPIFNA